MKRKKWIWLIGGSVFVIFLFIAGVLWINSSVKGKAMTVEEAQKIIEEKYAGKVKNIGADGKEYTFELERDTGTYQIVIDGKSGEISSFIRTGIKKNETTEETDVAIEEKGVEQKAPTKEQKEAAKEQTVKEKEQASAAENKPPSPGANEPQEKPKQLTEAEATKIARAQVNGEVDDVDLETIGGVLYYIVEVETADEKEATVQINAITGEVKSVSWDD